MTTSVLNRATVEEASRMMLLESHCGDCGSKLAWIGDHESDVPHAAGWTWAAEFKGPSPDDDQDDDDVGYALWDTDISDSKDLCPTCAERFRAHGNWLIYDLPTKTWIEKLDGVPAVTRIMVPAWVEQVAEAQT